MANPGALDAWLELVGGSGGLRWARRCLAAWPALLAEADWESVRELRRWTFPRAGASSEFLPPQGRH
ncbi:hypothetical protein ACWDKQ_14710 [Saccharopolyspora sp. NPDC000995]